MTKDEAIHKALKVLNCLNNDRVYETAWVKGAINACEEALEQPAQEPVIENNCYGDGNVYRGLKSEDSKIKTYHINTHPHQWQGLTDDEIKTIHNKHIQDDNVFEFARSIEQALKEKNT